MENKKFAKKTFVDCLAPPIRYDFRRENFRGWTQNHEIRESFLPRKFPAIQYVACVCVCVYVCVLHVISCVWVQHKLDEADEIKRKFAGDTRSDHIALLRAYNVCNSTHI